jgi:uncharacterized protein (DUF1778 family)
MRTTEDERIKRLNVRLTRDEHRELKLVASSQGLTMSELVLSRSLKKKTGKKKQR